MHRLGHVADFLRRNEGAVPTYLEDTIERAASVWPHLKRRDGSVPMIGDTPRIVEPRDWQPILEARVGRALPPPTEGVEPRARLDGSRLLVDPIAGYAIFSSQLNGSDSNVDTHLVFKINTFKGSHYHRDALAIDLYGLGRDWLVDSGMLSMEEDDPLRMHLRSAMAHNTIVVPGVEPDLGRVSPGRWFRGNDEDVVSSTHEWGAMRHTRTVRFRPHHSIVVVDQLESRDETARVCHQLFHLAPDLRCESIHDNRVVIRSPDGSRLTMHQTPGVAVRWLDGGKSDGSEPQGWYSSRFGEAIPGPVIQWSPPPAIRYQLITRLILQPI
jgi:hypothetical protein